MSSKWRQVNLICSLNADGTGVELKHQPIPTVRQDLLELFEVSELKKYFTDEELVELGGVVDEIVSVAKAPAAEAAAEPDAETDAETDGETAIPEQKSEEKAGEKAGEKSESADEAVAETAAEEK